jgi:hypothetical protein
VEGDQIAFDLGPMRAVSFRRVQGQPEDPEWHDFDYYPIPGGNHHHLHDYLTASIGITGCVA